MTTCDMLLALLDHTPETTNLMDFFERFGLPVSLLVVILWGMVKTARWLAPRIDSLISRHERLLETLEAELGNHGQLLASMEEHQSHVLECLRALHEKVGH